MTDQDNLRDRIEQIIEDKTYAPAPDGLIAAQAIINEFGLTYIRTGGSIVGKWEPRE